MVARVQVGRGATNWVLGLRLHRSLLYWLALPALLLVLTLVFASQLYWSGYITPWSRAFAAEAAYWVAWLPFAPPIFWMCRRLYGRAQGWWRYAWVILLGAVLTAVLHPLLVQGLDGLRLALSGGIPPEWMARLPRMLLRLTGIDLPVYAILVLGWHAVTYNSALRDRQLQSLEMESQLRQAQLHALRSQLNPHFLFNALHSLAELVHQNPQLADRLIVRLGELLRQALQSSTLPDISLAEELDFVKGYVEIEQLRLGERLSVRWEVDPHLLQLRVPSLILQPLIENAIQHGVEPAGVRGQILIRVQRTAEFLHLQVSDSGPGFTAASGNRGNGIGLSNTRLRLQKLYGAQQRFDLSTKEGCLVNLHIPISTPAAHAP